MALDKLPYATQWISDEDIAAVVDVLRSDWLTTGPAVPLFEQALAAVCESPHAVAVSNGTAALHVAVAAAGIQPGDEVIVPSLTFAATANAVVYQGATPVFVDVNADTLLIDTVAIERAVTRRSRAVIAVDFAGQPADYAALRKIADHHGLIVIGDAAHALGARDQGHAVGSLADLTTFSFHPVKHVTTGEGGMVTTSRAEWDSSLRRLRNHGIVTDARERERLGVFAYDMAELGYNYRLSDLQCALGIAQLRRLPAFLVRRRQIAAMYREQLAGMAGVTPLSERDGVDHAYHLFVVRIDAEQCGCDRRMMYERLLQAGVQTNVHYRPVHLHSFYRDRFGTAAGLCPVAEQAGEQVLSLPMFPRMTDDDVNRVVREMKRAAAGDQIA